MLKHMFILASFHESLEMPHNYVDFFTDAEFWIFFHGVNTFKILIL